MSILTADNLGLSFGAFDLFKGISVSIANDSKIGLIGPNGIGKTSLLLILAGINQPTTGTGPHRPRPAPGLPAPGSRGCLRRPRQHRLLRNADRLLPTCRLNRTA